MAIGRILLSARAADGSQRLQRHANAARTGDLSPGRKARVTFRAHANYLEKSGERGTLRKIVISIVSTQIPTAFDSIHIEALVRCAWDDLSCAKMMF